MTKNINKLHITKHQSKSPLPLILQAGIDLEVIIDPDLQVTIYEQVDNGNFESNVSLEIGQGSLVNYFSYYKDVDLVSIYRSAKVDKGAKVNWFDLNLGGEGSFSEIVVRLLQPEAQSNIYGLFLQAQKESFKFNHIHHHQADRTKSDIKVKGSLDDLSRVDGYGLIKIDLGARNCQGYQHQETLLLSDKAQVDSVPDLDIANDQVQCSHGVAISKLDDDKLFYLRSRGLPEEKARYVFLQAFFSDILKNINDEKIKKEVFELITQKIT